MDGCKRLAVAWLVGIYLWSPYMAVSGEETTDPKKAAPLELTDYRIGIGDILAIHTWKEETLSLEGVRVRNDGKITFPLLDDIPAAGNTPVELKQVIQERLTQFVEAPSVTVTVVNPVSQRYYILGEVKEVGEYPLLKKLTVIQAFALAKGFTEWASKDKILLYRKESGKDRIYNIDYKDLVKGRSNTDMRLRADDIIIVP